MGRPSTYNDEIADRICAELAMRRSLKSICEREDWAPSESCVYNWLNQNPAFVEKYTRARDYQIEAYVDEMVEIADDDSADPNSRRVRVDTRKWIASKLKPKKYGERIEQDIKVTGSIEEVLSRRFARLNDTESSG